MIYNIYVYIDIYWFILYIDLSSFSRLKSHKMAIEDHKSPFSGSIEVSWLLRKSPTFLATADVEFPPFGVHVRWHDRPTWKVPTAGGTIAPKKDLVNLEI